MSLMEYERQQKNNIYIELLSIGSYKRRKFQRQVGVCDTSLEFSNLFDFQIYNKNKPRNKSD